MPLPNPGQDAVPFTTLTAEFYDNTIENIESLADGTGFDAGAVGTTDIADLAIATGKIADDAVTDAKLDYPRWYQEIGRTTLAVAGDTISVTSLPARAYLKIIVNCKASGQLQLLLRFNSDSGTNYTRQPVNASTTTVSTSSSVSQTSHALTGTSTGIGHVAIIECFKFSGLNTWSTEWRAVEVPATAATGQTARYGQGAYFGSAAVTSIQIINNGTGDFAIGSEVIILGHD